MTNIRKSVVFVIFIISTSFLLCSVSSQSTVETLPGYSGILPFKLETGYISVGESEEIELFYYFIESERDPTEDPLLLWLTGGPGCSGLSALAIEIGPVAFDVSSFNGSLPSLIPRQHSWTKIANVIFIDSPVGTGYSYATQPNSYNTSDTLSAKYILSFLKKWLLNHPAFIRNDLYIAGDSYGGKMVPMVVLEILNSNEAGVEPQMSLQGYLVGNPVTNLDKDHNEKIPYAHGMGLIPTEYYELAKSNCLGQYVNPDPNNVQCLNALELINVCLRDISDIHILEANCESTENYKRGVTLLEDDWFGANQLSSKSDKIICIKISKALVYSGDHDISIPYLATMKWIQYLNLTLDDHWRPWNVNGQIAGYTRRYKMKDFSLTFATVKGGGHIAVQFYPEQCLAMFNRWVTSKPL